MTKAFNLSQLANNVNSSGQIDGQAGIDGPVNEAGTLVTANFSIQEAGGKLYFYHGSTAIASMDSAGDFVQLGNVTAYGTP